MKLKGALLVGQSGGPTAVINASLAGVIEEARAHPEIESVYGMLRGVQGLLEEEMIDLGAESEEAIGLLPGTPASALGSCRKKLSTDDYTRVVSILKAHNVRYLCYIGGNDSADTCHKIGQAAHQAGWEMRVIGVPKTVDNDLAYTDHCPGYGSVARFNAAAARDAGLDSAAMCTVTPVKIIETMGRNAGWITASTALAREQPGDAPHLIYLPERAFDPEAFIADIERELEKGRGCVIAVCEGLRDENGQPIVLSRRSTDVDGFGHAQLGGIGDYLQQLVSENMGVKVRGNKAGTFQRVFGALQSEVDVAEARMVGAAAVRQACEGVTDKMVTLERVSTDPYRCETGLAPLEEVANAERPMPDEFINDAGNDVTDAFVEYARPLIGGPLPPYARLHRRSVPKKLEA